MALRGFVLGAAFLVAGLLPAAADSITATVGSWNMETRTLVLGDKTEFQNVPDDIFVPEDLAAGETVVISFEGSAEDGVDAILAIEVQP
ncbi:hypothetical protein [Roseibium aggregatum]|uniref:DUF5666 domain-containing protein n=1 Tax=Roseibium aggregatum TaxID=187304 RepID=A0A939EID4_9HYPH|nr:hypothetical protein [Roseibium aggregatum]MBN9673579.1 hypothetical protein [Roseibium aggregatum]